VDLKEKVAIALKEAIEGARLRLEDDDGISGFVVSSEFRGMSALDRQTLIDKALRNSSVKFSKQERRNMLAIAALTPAEFETVDPTFLGSHP
jgi:acid stress-induced BolA-like protein IbaG/YrbA